MSLCLVCCHLFPLPSEAVCRADDPCAICDSDYALDVEDIDAAQVIGDRYDTLVYAGKVAAAHAKYLLVAEDPNSTQWDVFLAGQEETDTISEAADVLMTKLWENWLKHYQDMIKAWEDWEACMQAGGC